MDKEACALVTRIEAGLLATDIDLASRTWLDGIPSVPGWYWLETDCSLAVLERLGQPKGLSHYNIPGRVRSARCLIDLGFAIVPADDTLYVVYSGHAKNLRSRAREHVFGHSKTACLGLSKYLKTLKSYQWRFRYAPLSTVQHTPCDDERLRAFGEQAWRAKHGWPVLCAE